MPGGARVPGTSLRARSGAGGLQHRRDDPLARLQRHLAGRRVGPSVRQPRRHPRGRRLPQPRKRVLQGKTPLTVRDVLTAMIKAHEIQGVLALENSFNRVGLDHVLLVRVASTAVVTRDARRHARADHQRGLATPGSTAARCAPIATRRTPARARAGRPAMRPAARVRLALHRADRARWAIPSALTRQDLGLPRRAVQGQAVHARRSRFGSYVMENVLFKISFPAEFHAQTAVEAAMHAASAGGATGSTRSSASSSRRRSRRAHHRQDRPARTIPADRDHCLQYMVAVPLIFGRLTAEDYEDAVAARSAHRCAAREDGGAREPDASRASTTSRTSATSATPCRCSSRTARATERVQVEYPDRPSQAPRGRHAGAGEEVRDVGRRALPAEAGRAHQGAVRRSASGSMRMPVNELVAALVTNGPGA